MRSGRASSRSVSDAINEWEKFINQNGEHFFFFEVMR